MGKLKDRILRWHWSSFGLVVLVLIGLVAFGSILWWWVVPTWGVSPTTTQIELVKTIGQIVLGALVLVTLWVAWRRANAAERTVEVAQEGQITERFTKAVEQLGNSENMAIRLGGIYALGRIAKDSGKDHWQVMEVLTAYLRENNWWNLKPERQRKATGNQVYLITRDLISTDIQAILNVLKRRNFEYEASEQRLDLTQTNLQGANIGGTNLSRAILIDADLRNANLISADLRGADLTGADLQGADFRCADFRNAVGLTQEQVNSARTDETTKFPDYLISTLYKVG